jgi:K+-sensing histidine kinase KdpD
MAILEQRATPQQLPVCRGLADEIAGLTKLVDELTEYLRVSLQGQQQPLTLLALSTVVRAAIVREHAEERAIQAVPEEILVWGNSTLLERAFANLIRNAQQHAGDRTVELRAEPGGHFVRLLVTDHGPGVPELVLLNLGGHFHRAGEAGEQRTSRGLGLTIVRQCVHVCGGTVQFRNRREGGFEAEMQLQTGPVPPRRPRGPYAPAAAELRWMTPVHS